MDITIKPLTPELNNDYPAFDDDNLLKFVRLGELMLYYWGKAYHHGTN